MSKQNDQLEDILDELSVIKESVETYNTKLANIEALLSQQVSNESEKIESESSRALKNLSNSKPNNKNSGAATPLCCDPAFIRNFRKYLKNSPNNASQTYIWLHLTAFRVFLRHFRLICLHS